MKNLTSIALASSLLAAACTGEVVKDEPPTCAETQCGANATCSDASGEPLCSCDAGFAGDGLSCADVDECATANTCGSAQACVNTVGGHDCLARSCAGIRQGDPTAVDGEYTLYVGGDPAKPWLAYCADMATAPAEYLALPGRADGQNFSQYTAGGASPGTDVRTRYELLRIDPETLRVDIGDQRFAHSTGALDHSGHTPVTSMPFGVAMSCGGIGVANIDLTDTPFVVASTFAQTGAGSAGQATISSDAKIVDLTGEGFCGWTAPEGAPFDPFNAAAGFVLQLGYGG